LTRSPCSLDSRRPHRSDPYRAPTLTPPDRPVSPVRGPAQQERARHFERRSAGVGDECRHLQRLRRPAGEERQCLEVRSANRPAGLCGARRVIGRWLQELGGAVFDIALSERSGAGFGRPWSWGRRRGWLPPFWWASGEGYEAVDSHLGHASQSTIVRIGPAKRGRAAPEAHRSSTTGCSSFRVSSGSASR
jgi:hypothetical protein